ncbi:glycosyltransferase family 25 protein [Mesorhizobium sp. AR10]|uniref:glycosyltransferase family 25 protein n=1 Tax=Mesorhizobium sp. AR10 TaxID=2865839 RepID=UPI0029E7D72E|nr:glycosyltransferase family 25 protein [Mesorhizobium sp. AR10]
MPSSSRWCARDDHGRNAPFKMPLSLDLGAEVVLPVTGRSRARFGFSQYAARRPGAEKSGTQPHPYAMDAATSSLKASIPLKTMKCLVINLDRSQDRLAHMTGEFIRMGVAFERVAAIDARDRPDLSRMPLRVKRLSPLRLTNAEIACLLSHRACWAIVAARDDAYGAIFEDDAVFSAKAGALLADAGWIPAAADIVKLETFFKKTTIARKRVSAGHGFSLSRLYRSHIGAAGYIISRQAARDLIAATEDIGIPVDHVIFNPGLATSSGKTIYQLVPALCTQDQFLGDKAVGLPSLLNQERSDQWAASGMPKKRKKTGANRIKTEFNRLAAQIADFCRFRQEKIIPFDYRGERIRPPHTQRRENAL